jgi:hypothetical protein
MTSSTLAQKLDAYLRFRAAKEGEKYSLTPEFFDEHIRKGIVEAFGISWHNEELIDKENPETLAEWLSGFSAREGVETAQELFDKRLAWVKGVNHATMAARVVALEDLLTYVTRACAAAEMKDVVDTVRDKLAALETMPTVKDD